MQTLSSSEAADFLGIKHATLYTYVSKGLLRSVHGEGPDRKARRYPLDDLRRLKLKAGGAEGTAYAATPGGARASVWHSDLTALTDAGPVYRGRAALDLVASGAGFEAACEWLWTGNEEAAAWSIEGFGASPRRLGELLPAGTPPAQSLLLVLPALALRDPARFGAALPAEPARARELVLRLAAFLALGRDPQQVYEAYRTGGVAATAAKALGATPKGDALRLLDTALVLSLDRGLDEAALAARLASASGADLYAALAAGLAVLASPRVSGAVEQTESFFRNLENADAVRTVLTERLRRGEKIPGFGALPGEATVAHHLIGTAKNGKGVDVILETVGVLKNAGLGEPGAAVGLCAVVFAAGLPDDSAAAITLLARLAGLVAHVLEVRART